MHIIDSFWTLAPAGLSVCLRYTIDYRQPRYGVSYLFTFGPSRALKLRFEGNNQYMLFLNGYSLYLNTDLFLLPKTEQTLWTKICLIIDSGKNVVQMFSGRQASIRKILPFSVRCYSLFATLFPRASFPSHWTHSPPPLLSLYPVCLVRPTCHWILGFWRPGDGCAAVGLSSLQWGNFALHESSHARVCTYN